MVERSLIETQLVHQSKRFCQLLSARYLSHIAQMASHVSHIFLLRNRPIAGIKYAQNAAKFVVNVSSTSGVFKCEVRPAPRVQERLRESAKLGFSIAIFPEANTPKNHK
jgi:hypothetical protein